MSNGNKRTYLREVNPHLICPLCRGYLIDATTVVECLHSFCRSCILKHLRKDAKCPSCKLLLNTAKPNIKADKTLQDIVYKLVPGLYHKEMKKRREYYSKHPEHGFAANLNHIGGADSATPEQRGEDVSGRLIFAPEDFISLSLEHLPVGADPLTLLSKNHNNNDAADSNQLSDDNQKQQKLNGNVVNRRYLRCPALVTIALLKKFLALKYSVDVTRFNIDIYHRRAPLPEHWTLMDVAYIFAWKRNAPIRFFYRVTDEQRLEAPPNARPSTPGLGATQPPTDEQPNEPDAKPTEPDLEDEKTKNKPSTEISIPREPSAITPSPPKKIEGEFLAKRSAPSPKEKEKEKLLTPEKSDDVIKQVKTPIKILKNSDGHYQVLRGSSLPTQKSPTTPKSSPPPVTPEFSVVSIDDAKSNGVKITLKQCTPGNNNSKKPKVISNVLLRNPNEKINSEDKQKKKVNVNDSTSPTKQPRKLPENTDKKQFLQGFRLKAAQEPEEVSKPEDTDSVEAQVRNIIQKSMINRGIKPPGEESPKKNEPEATTDSTTEVKANDSPNEVKTTPTSEVRSTSTNIADRLSDSKKLVSAPETPAISSSDESQQPIDVYAFPNDPPTSVPPGAVKRKCPPGLPLFESRKKQQNCTPGKRAGINTARGGAVKCYRNQTKPIYPKPPPSPSRPLQSMPNPIGNSANVNANSGSPNATVSSTSSKPNSPSPTVLISNDTRTLLDGCGLTIPASLSITLTASKSPGPSLQPDPREVKDPQKNVEKLNPTITLNDKSVDTRVLKALKSGQMKMPMANAKTKGRQLSESPQGPPAKRKKDEASTPPTSQPRNALDLSGAKKAEMQIRIPTPLGKFKSKPNWPKGNIPIKPKEDPSTFANNGQVVTLNGGQRFYRAPPGSLTPAVHRVADIPTPTRAPVYAPCFSSPVSSSPRPVTHNLSSVFPSLQSLYALSQAPSLEQFHNMDSRMRLAATTAPKKDISPTSQVGNKSHIAAQCAPIKPARSSLSPFAVPLAKQSNSGLTIKPVASKPNSPAGSSNNNNSNSKAVPVVSTAVESEGTASSTNSSTVEDKEKKSDEKDALVKPDSETNETCPSSTEESNSQQGAASPRVTSTASPSPPPSAGEATAKTIEKKPTEPEKNQSSEQVTSSNNKSPESPDSSSVVTESSNLVDSTKSTKSREPSPVKITEPKKDDDSKTNEKNDDAQFKKPMTSETLQKRFLAAFPSNEWANNPVAAEQFGNFLKSLSSMQAEAQSKNTKAVE